MTTRLPRVGIVCDVKTIDLHPYHCVGETYIRAVRDGAMAVPLLLPALGAALDFDTILELVDGLVLTGSPSNVAPSHYGATLLRPEMAEFIDSARDATTLPLINMAIEQAIPILGICRGFQELNVALGGTLLQAVHETPGHLDHREDDRAPLHEQYADAHTIELVAGGRLAGLIKACSATVNSLHGQGVAQLAPGLVVEARSADGLIEAFSVAGAKSFAMAVQWHPEWQFHSNPLSQALFTAFGAACQERRTHRMART